MEDSKIRKVWLRFLSIRLRAMLAKVYQTVRRIWLYWMCLTQTKTSKEAVELKELVEVVAEPLTKSGETLEEDRTVERVKS
jgi:hypothetical protein